MSADDSEPVSRRGFIRAATGTAAAGAAVGQAAAQGGNESSGGGSGGTTKTVTVGPGGSLTFEPSELKVTPGTTVKFDWDSPGHNIVVQSQPDGSNWKGSEGGASKLYGPSHTHTHTFEKKGTYEYYCAPHKQSGMTGTIEVVESLNTGGGGGGPPEIPDSAKTLGIASVIGMISTLGLAYFFLRYGGDYEQP